MRLVVNSTAFLGEDIWLNLTILQVFDGPISESIPSSIASFSHRRNRKDSTVSFTYFQEEEDFVQWPNAEALDAESDVEDLSSMNGVDEVNLESARSSLGSKRPSFSRASVEEPLLSRRVSNSSHFRDKMSDSRLNQKIYIASEDLTVVFAGFTTSTCGFIVYVTFCILTFGFAYLLFRWLPRLRVRLVGKPTPLRKCQWIAVEVRLRMQITLSTFWLIMRRTSGINLPLTVFPVICTVVLFLLSLLTPNAICMTKTTTRLFLLYDISTTDISGSSTTL